MWRATQAGRLTTLAQQVWPCLLPCLQGVAALISCRNNHATPPCHTQAARHLSSTAAAASAAAPPPSVGRLNHVAIAVPDVREAAAKYRDVLGVKVSRMWQALRLGLVAAFSCRRLPWNHRRPLLSRLSD